LKHKKLSFTPLICYFIAKEDDRMPHVTDLGLFIILGIILNILSEPDSLYIALRSAKGGFKAGSAASFGIGAGTIVHILAAAFGLSALLAASATGFMIVKYIGVAYLLYLGLTMILSPSSESITKTSDSLEVSSPSPTSYGVIFKQGFLTNILNPKIALFFLVFVPQFITANAPNKALTFI
jgi:threonine/homoserine/homoserine lactone efflux protein